jgi:hypothetical protein
MALFFLCPRMGGQIFAPGNICTSTFHGGRIPQGATDGDAVMPKDGQADICSSAIAPALP